MSARSSPEKSTAPIELPALGTMLANRYLLEERIAVGGMATVFRARDTMLDQMVAVKIIHTGTTDLTASGGRLLSDLRLEAIASMRLSHPNIVRIYNYEKGEHWGFLVMENVVGEDLRAFRNRFPERRVPISEALRIADKALSGLAHAHGLGIIHYDIKPANMMITPTGDIKLCDFGLSALAAYAQKGQHLDLVVAGTPQYISPEAINQGQVDHRSDLYSLAATLYDLIVGVPPFGRDPETAYRGHLLEPPPSSPMLSPALQKILHRALAKKPSDRFESAEAMRTQLLALSNGKEFQDASMSSNAPKPTPPGVPDWLEIEVEVDSVEGGPRPSATNASRPPPLPSAPAGAPRPPPPKLSTGPLPSAPTAPSLAKPAALNSGVAAPSKPPSASPSNVKGSKMKTLEQQTLSTMGIHGAARADAGGNVNEVTGSVEGEMLCATIAMSSAPLERATDLLGLGVATDWFLAAKKGCFYVHREPAGFVVGRGDAVKSPEGTMKKFAIAVG